MNMISTKDWISRNIRDGDKINSETYHSIADFCVMWALFEGTELHGIAIAVDELGNVSKRVADNIDDIDIFLEFWVNRYISEGTTNHKFEQLNINHQPHKDLVSQVLLGTEKNREKVTHALLLIVYRLRNNLFHGVKDITKINGQASNLTKASLLLKNVLLASGRYIFLNQE